MTSKPYKDILLGIGEAGSTRQAITKKQLQEMPVMIPITIEEQERIAVELDECIKETQRLEAIYKQKLANLAELKQSILQQAFTGELTGDAVAEEAGSKAADDTTAVMEQMELL
jgi:type I restriction enzyme S subunit